MQRENQKENNDFNEMQKIEKKKINYEDIRFTNIKVIGVGGGGCNSVSRLVQDGVKNVDFIAINTDTQALLTLPEKVIKLNIGKNSTKGLGAGSDIELGRKAAEESIEEIKQVISGADMVFITAGMGGGTGTGASPIIASIAKEMGILTIAIVTKPFSFEGKIRIIIAEEGINNLKPNVDAMIIIPNDKLFSIAEENTSLIDSFKLADNVIKYGVVGITEIILKPGLINIDFSDIQSILKDSGSCWMGIGIAKGENRAEEAAIKAVDSPLLEMKVEGAKRVLFNIMGGPDLTLLEVNKASQIIYQSVDQDAKIILGATVDENMKDEVKVILIATEFPEIAFQKENRKERIFGFSEPKQTISLDLEDLPPLTRRRKILFTE